MKKMLIPLLLLNFTIHNFLSVNAFAESVREVFTNQQMEGSAFGILSSESEAAHILTSGMYETLMRWDDSLNAFKPILAQSWEQKKPTEIIFYLKKNVFFHNLQPMSADDVVKSFYTIKQKTNFVSAMLNGFSGIKKLTKDSVVVKLVRPDPLAMRRLAQWLRIYPCSKLCGDDATSIHLPGTGPWVFSRSDGATFHFVSFSKYWGVHPLSDQFLKVKTGLDTFSDTDIKNSRVVLIDGLALKDRLLLRKCCKFEIINTKLNYSDFGIFNLLAENGIVHDKRIRKAVNLALDRNALVKLVYDNRVTKLASLSLPSDAGHNAELTGYPYDLIQAKLLVAEYKAENPQKDLTIRVGLQSKGDTYSKFLQFFITSMKQIGLKVRVKEEYVVASHRTLYTKDIDLVFGGDPSPYGHFDFYVQNFFLPNAAYQMSQDPMIFESFDKIKFSPTESSANQIYSLIDQRIHDEVLAIPGVQYQKLVALNPNGKFIRSSAGLLDLGNIR